MLYFTIWWIGAIINFILMSIVGVVVFTTLHSWRRPDDYAGMLLISATASLAWPIIPVYMLGYFYMKYWVDILAE